MTTYYFGIFEEGTTEHSYANAIEAFEDIRDAERTIARRYRGQDVYAADLDCEHTEDE